MNHECCASSCDDSLSHSSGSGTGKADDEDEDEGGERFPPESQGSGTKSGTYRPYLTSRHKGPP